VAQLADRLAELETATDAEGLDLGLVVRAGEDSGSEVGSWRLRVAGGRARLEPDHGAEATTVLLVDTETAEELAGGALPVTTALAGGRLRVRGDVGQLLRMTEVVSHLQDALAPASD
jgi:hypothetical protein